MNDFRDVKNDIIIVRKRLINCKGVDYKMTEHVDSILYQEEINQLSSDISDRIEEVKKMMNNKYQSVIKDNYIIDKSGQFNFVLEYVFMVVRKSHISLDNFPFYALSVGNKAEDIILENDLAEKYSKLSLIKMNILNLIEIVNKNGYISELILEGISEYQSIDVEYMDFDNCLDIFNSLKKHFGSYEKIYEHVLEQSIEDDNLNDFIDKISLTVGLRKEYFENIYIDIINAKTEKDIAVVVRSHDIHLLNTLDLILREQLHEFSRNLQ